MHACRLVWSLDTSGPSCSIWTAVRMYSVNRPIPVCFKLKSRIGPLCDIPITSNAMIISGSSWIGGCYIPVGHQFSLKVENKKKKLSLFFSLNRLKFKLPCLWSWAASQETVTTMVRLGISIYTTGSCLVGIPNHLELVDHKRGNSSPGKKK